MRTAIIIIGHMRTWEQCKDNFIESFQHLNPEIFVSTYDLQYNYHPAQWRWMGFTPDATLSKYQIENMLNGINLIDLDIESISGVRDEYKSKRDKLHPNFNDEEHTYLQHRKIDRALSLVKKNEELTKYKFDNIIKIRFDILHNKFTYDIGENHVIISSGNVFPNDVIIATKRDTFMGLSDFFMKEFYNPIYNDSHLKAPHNLLLKGFEHLNLEIDQKDIMDCVVRKAGKQYYNNIQ